MSLLYGGARTTVVQLRRLPSNAKSFDAKTTPFEQRGWCHFEEAVSSIQKPYNQLLNLALAKEELENGDWQAISAKAQLDRGLPSTPDKLRRQLAFREFGCPADRALLADLYEDLFSLVAPTVKAVNLQQPSFSSRSWGKKDLASLAAVLPCFESCESLNLRGRQLGDAGAVQVAAELPKLGQLVELNFASCGIGDDGLKGLAVALKEMGRLELLSLHGCKFTEKGLKMLKSALDCAPPRLPALHLEALTLPEDLEHTAEGKAIESMLQQQDSILKFTQARILERERLRWSPTQASADPEGEEEEEEARPPGEDDILILRTHSAQRAQISEVQDWLQRNDRGKARLFKKTMETLVGKCKVVQWM